MVQIKAELHCHTYFSDGHCTVEKCIDIAKKKGLGAIAITDHDTAEGVLPYWNEQPDGLIVIPGEEISTDKGHVLGLFVRESIPPGEFGHVVSELKSQDAIALMAHPFHIPLGNVIRKKKLMKWTDADINRLDGIEIYNGHNRRSANIMAAEYAERKNLIGISGSDAHTASEIGNACTMIECVDVSLAGVKSAIREGMVEALPPQRENYHIYLMVGLLNKIYGKRYVFK